MRRDGGKAPSEATIPLARIKIEVNHLEWRVRKARRAGFKKTEHHAIQSKNTNTDRITHLNGLESKQTSAALVQRNLTTEN